MNGQSDWTYKMAKEKKRRCQIDGGAIYKLVMRNC